jgi:hypothetical protein
MLIFLPLQGQKTTIIDIRGIIDCRTITTI